MKKEKVEIIQEAETLKNVMWFLRGYLIANKDEDAISEMHINALHKAINYIYDYTDETTYIKELEEKVDDLNTKIQLL